ncbi:hypothetical protein GCM10009547_17220 [Sporichthya brevicatena]|uniref:Transcriptional regulator, AbiEi antitoxin, Type IV TA system n=1 Tax=Sporichthya brevicatena TaxID=171442 RepID=A0ABP3RST1_9ACTN
MDTRHALIFELAATQQHVVSAADVALCGVDDAEVDRLCRRGDWTRLRRGLYHPQPPPSDADVRLRLDCAAAIRALDIKDAAIAHVSAGRLWGAKWRTDPEDDRIWVACDVPKKPRYYPGLRILPAGLPDEHVTLLEGLPVSTPARTAVDLARHLHFEPGLVAVESLRFQHKISDAQLAAVLEECRGWPHIRRARRTIEFSTDLSESPLESDTRLAFLRAMVPPYRQQVEVVDALGVKRRLDFLFGLRAGVETDGRLKYSSPEDLWREKKRQDALLEVGFPLLRLTAADIYGDPRMLNRRIIDHMIRTGDWIEGVGPAHR